MGHKKRSEHSAKQPHNQPSDIPASDKDNDANPSRYASATESQPSQTKGHSGMKTFEKIMAFFTLTGLVVAAFTGAIFWKQLRAMKIDSRAWVTINGSVQISQDKATGNVLVLFPASIDDTGKTPAKGLTTQIVVEKVKNGESPSFRYDNVPRTLNTVGILFPHSPFPTQAALLRFNANTVTQTEQRPLFTAEYQELLDGNAYIAVYSRTTYKDIFGTEHWVQTCAYSTPATKLVFLTAKTCSDYNDVDND